MAVRPSSSDRIAFASSMSTASRSTNGGMTAAPHLAELTCLVSPVLVLQQTKALHQQLLRSFLPLRAHLPAPAASRLCLKSRAAASIPVLVAIERSLSTRMAHTCKFSAALSSKATLPGSTPPAHSLIPLTSAWAAALLLRVENVTASTSILRMTAAEVLVTLLSLVRITSEERIYHIARQPAEG